MNSPTFFIFCGYSAAGKSTLAKHLADSQKFGLITSEEVTDQITRERGYIRTRDLITDIGEQNFMTDVSAIILAQTRDLQGIHGIVLDAAGGKLLEEMIRSNFTESRIVTIAVQTDRELRTERIMGRMGGVERGAAEVELSFRDAFLEKVDVEGSMNSADYKVDNTLPFEENCELLISQLRSDGLID